jgi:hypothetical protein
VGAVKELFLSSTLVAQEYVIPAGQTQNPSVARPASKN